MIGPNSSTQCQNKSKHSISFDNIATLLPSFRSGPLVSCYSLCIFFYSFVPISKVAKGPLLKEGKSVAMLPKEMLCFDLF